MEIEKYNAIAAQPAIQKALRRIELFVNNLHVRKPTRAFWEQLKRESFESINAALLSQNKENKTMEPTIKKLNDIQKEVILAKGGKGLRYRAAMRLYVRESATPFVNGEYPTVDMESPEVKAFLASQKEACDGKRVEDTPTPPANGFVPVRMEDFNAKNYIYRGIYLIVRDFKEETDGKYSASFEVSGSDIRRFKSLTDLNAFLETQWLALGGQKGDK